MKDTDDQDIVVAHSGDDGVRLVREKPDGPVHFRAFPRHERGIRQESERVKQAIFVTFRLLCSELLHVAEEYISDIEIGLPRCPKYHDGFAAATF